MQHPPNPHPAFPTLRHLVSNASDPASLPPTYFDPAIRAAELVTTFLLSGPARPTADHLLLDCCCSACRPLWDRLGFRPAVVGLEDEEVGEEEEEEEGEVGAAPADSYRKHKSQATKDPKLQTSSSSDGGASSSRGPVVTVIPPTPKTFPVVAGGGGAAALTETEDVSPGAADEDEDSDSSSESSQRPVIQLRTESPAERVFYDLLERFIQQQQQQPKEGSEQKQQQIPTPAFSSLPSFVCLLRHVPVLLFLYFCSTTHEESVFAVEKHPRNVLSLVHAAMRRMSLSSFDSAVPRKTKLLVSLERVNRVRFGGEEFEVGAGVVGAEAAAAAAVAAGEEAILDDAFGVRKKKKRLPTVSPFVEVVEPVPKFDLASGGGVREMIRNWGDHVMRWDFQEDDDMKQMERQMWYEFVEVVSILLSRGMSFENHFEDDEFFAEGPEKAWKNLGKTYLRSQFPTEEELEEAQVAAAAAASSEGEGEGEGEIEDDVVVLPVVVDDDDEEEESEEEGDFLHWGRFADGEGEEEGEIVYVYVDEEAEGEDYEVVYVNEEEGEEDYLGVEEEEGEFEVFYEEVVVSDDEEEEEIQEIDEEELDFEEDEPVSLAPFVLGKGVIFEIVRLLKHVYIAQLVDRIAVLRVLFFAYLRSLQEEDYETILYVECAISQAVLLK